MVTIQVNYNDQRILKVGGTDENEMEIKSISSHPQQIPSSYIKQPSNPYEE